MALAPFAFTRDDHIYLVAPVAPFQPEEAEIEEFAFVDVLKHAPNPHIVWMRGQYVEGDQANGNGAMWLSDELAVKSTTPNFMPVTVMHDPRTAVGLIADTRLVIADEQSKRSRLDNTIGLWGHRFPEAVEEALSNYEQGSLMQSMECRPGYYDCSTCGTRYPKLPGGAEERNWCAHLKGDAGEKAARILGAVCFTGTGLIFGSRGAEGAYSEAHLQPLMDEVAEFHERAQSGPRHKPKAKRSNTVDIDDKRYEELVTAESERNALKTQVGELTETAGKVPDLEATVERLETEKKAVETERDDEKAKREGLEETAREQTLASERWDKLGKDFLAKLGEITTGRLKDQAKSLSEEDWASRISELEEMAQVKADAGGKPPADDKAGDGTFTPDEVARSGAGSGGQGGGGGGGEPAPARRRSVVTGLAKTVGAAK